MSSEDDSTKVHSTQNIVSNKRALLYIQDSTSLVFGLGAGILQLESLFGFSLFFLCYTMVSSLYVAWICQFQPSAYHMSPINEIYFESLFRELTGFVMAWTFSYAFVG